VSVRAKPRSPWWRAQGVASVVSPLLVLAAFSPPEFAHAAEAMPVFSIKALGGMLEPAVIEVPANTRFKIHFYEAMDRAGAVPIGMHPGTRHERLCGCEQTGSRAVQWVHITPRADCLLCCQDYYSEYVVGNLKEQKLNDILSGSRVSLLRRWVYGMEEAPDDFICRGCIYALTS